MIENKPSMTAQYVAMRRAVHQLLDSPLVFEDPLAVTIVESGRTTSADEPSLAHKISVTQRMRLKLGELSTGQIRAYLAARSRITENMLERAVEHGVQQYVVLGAGLDTFAYRNPHPRLRVFEVDHPATQAWKLQRLADRGITIPAEVTHVPADLSAVRLSTVLDAAGFKASVPTFVSWLGVTPYLEPANVSSTLKEIAALTSGGGGLVLDYLPPPHSLGVLRRVGFKIISAVLAFKGEPYRSFFEPSDIKSTIRGLGYSNVTDLGPEELNAEFFRNRSDGLRVPLALRIVTAFV